MDWLFRSGHAADLILAVMLIEGVWLVAARRWPTATAALALLPGALMIVALRLALTGANVKWLALVLLLSWPAHLADLRRRRPGGGA